MKSFARTTVAALAAAVAFASTASAQILVTPSSNGGPFCTSPAFGAASCSISDEHLGSHLRFTNTAVFNDPPLAWGGINGAGNVDLVSPIIASLWSTDGSAKMETSFLRVLAGSSEANTLTLKAFDVLGNLLGTAMNPSSGTSSFSIAAAGIHSFEVSGDDSWGLQEIEFAEPTLSGNVSTVPEPGSFVLVAAGLGGLIAAGRKRRKV